MDHERKLLVDYMMWRRICQREGSHLGRYGGERMSEGYISTSPAIDTAVTVGTGFHQKPGWLYVTVVHAGFQVPWGQQNYWGSKEGEIA